MSYLDDAHHAVYHNEPVYGSSPVNGRRTKDQLARLDALIIAATASDNPVTVRGVFYRVSSLGGVPKTEGGYRAVGRQLLKLRRSGDIPYHWIADGTRYVLHGQRFSSVDDALKQTARLYRRRLWDHAEVSVEVFAEKDAISGVVHPVCDQWDVPLGICRGYSSETFAHSIAAGLSRFAPTVMLNLGDHDPSGVDAWEDLVSKVRGFAPECDIEARRVAVTPEQIDELDLPTRPTKKTDTRSKHWTGGDSVEVDAIPAKILRQILGDEIEQYVDHHQLETLMAAEASERALLDRMVAS